MPMWIRHTIEIGDKGQYWCQECYRTGRSATASDKGHEIMDGDLRVVHSGLGRRVQELVNVSKTGNGITVQGN